MRIILLLFSILITNFHANTALSATLIEFDKSQLPLREHSAEIYDGEPQNFHPAFSVSACYATFNDMYLMLQGKRHNSEPNAWGVPAGKIEKGESPLDALLREVYEETGVSLNKHKVSFFKKLYIRTPQKDFVFYMYTYEFLEKPKITLNPLEHKSFEWMSYKKVMQTPMVLGNIKAFRLLHGESTTN